MWTVLRILSLAALILVLTVPAGSGATKVNVTLNPENGSGESGTATLRDVGSGETKVEVKITGEPGHPQPMHIHKGTCANLDPKPAYGLPSLMNGKSEATIDVPLSELEKGHYAINGHKSAQELSVYVFCGDIT